MATPDLEEVQPDPNERTAHALALLAGMVYEFGQDTDGGVEVRVSEASMMKVLAGDRLSTRYDPVRQETIFTIFREEETQDA